MHIHIDSPVAKSPTATDSLLLTRRQLRPTGRQSQASTQASSPSNQDPACGLDSTPRHIDHIYPGVVACLPTTRPPSRHTTTFALTQQTPAITDLPPRTRLQLLPTGSWVKHLSTIDSTLFHGFSGKCHFYAILSTDNPNPVSTRASTLPLTHDETGSARHIHSHRLTSRQEPNNH